MSTSTPSGQTAGESKLAPLLGLLESDPRNPRLRSKCLQLALDHADYATALRVADGSLELQPDDREALFGEATALIGRRDYAAAIPLLAILKVRAPASTAVLQNLGLCHYCLGDHEKAETELQNAFQAGECSAGLLRLLVSSRHHLGKLAEALSVAGSNAEAARQDPALSGVYSLAYLDAGQTARASIWARRALELDPDCVDALVVEGTSLAARTATAQAATECFVHALAKSPDTGRAWVGLAALALLRQDLPEALARSKRGVELMPTHVGSWHVLGWTHLLADDLASAQSAFQRALELNPNFSESQGSLAAVAALRSDAATAERLATLARRLDPACLSAEFTRAVLAKHAAEPERARAIPLAALPRLGSTKIPHG
jgi:tetratricopeptide (TPR) repeat protein